MKKGNIKCLLLTDIVGSRRISNRKAFEKALAQTLEKTAKEKAELFEKPMQVWKGLDETAALLKEPWRLHELMEAIDSGIAPQQMRYVLVRGPVEIDKAGEAIAGMTGEAFHIAATGMGILKSEGLRFKAQTGNEAFDKAWEGQLNLLALLKSGWTERQRMIYSDYSRKGVQQAVAQKLSVSQQTVSQALQSINAAQVQRLEKRLLQWAEQEWKKHVLD